MPSTMPQRAAALNDGKFECCTCCACGIQFWMPAQLEHVRLLDGLAFYCPLGHQLHFPKGKTYAQIAEERAGRAEREAANVAESLRIERAAHSATKGQLTKSKNRAARGVCPCCNRSFVNVARHVAGQHPDHVKETK